MILFERLALAVRAPQGQLEGVALDPGIFAKAFALLLSRVDMRPWGRGLMGRHAC
jgi:hypothetical protein